MRGQIPWFELRLSACLLVLLALALFAACLLGEIPMSLSRIFAAIVGGDIAADRVIVWEIRLPRALSAALAGGALAMSGAALQGLLRNPLAEPGVLGVTACSSLGAAVTIHFGLVTLNAWALPFGAATAALVATAILAWAAMRIRSAVTLILVGVGLSSFAAALMALLINLAPHPMTLSDMVNWGLGSVANRSLADIVYALPFLVAGFISMFLAGRGLSVLTLGEEAAAGVGADLLRIRTLVVAGAGCATAGAVMLAGGIGFVGIVAPHIVRPWLGHDPGRTLLPAALLGAIFVVVADIGVRLAPTSTELRLGVVAALVGAPAFIWIAVRRQGGLV